MAARLGRGSRRQESKLTSERGETSERLLPSLADRVQVLPAADVDAAVRDRQRRGRIVRQTILGNLLELRAGLDDRGDTVAGEQVHFPVRVNWRGAVDGPMQLRRRVHFLAGLGVEAIKRARLAAKKD